MSETNNNCSQCGQPFSHPACGPTHATVMAHRVNTYPEAIRLLEDIRAGHAIDFNRIDAFLYANRGRE